MTQGCPFSKNTIPPLPLVTLTKAFLSVVAPKQACASASAGPGQGQYIYAHQVGISLFWTP